MAPRPVAPRERSAPGGRLLLRRPPASDRAASGGGAPTPFRAAAPTLAIRTTVDVRTAAACTSAGGCPGGARRSSPTAARSSATPSAGCLPRRSPRRRGRGGTWDALTPSRGGATGASVGDGCLGSGSLSMGRTSIRVGERAFRTPSTSGRALRHRPLGTARVHEGLDRRPLGVMPAVVTRNRSRNARRRDRQRRARCSDCR